MTADPEYYVELMQAFPDEESLTVLLVAGATRDDVATVLGIDLDDGVDFDDVLGGDDSTAWALLEVPGGVVAIEPTGFGDPTRRALAALSSGGHAAAVVRNNILAHQRFGCARDGRLLFDDNEYMYISDPSVVPDELRELFDLAWDDLSTDSDDEGGDEGPDGFSVGMAMAELVTGLEVTADQVETLLESVFHPAASQQYAEELDG